MARIKKIMSKNILTLEKSAKVSQAAKLLASNNQGCVFIVEKGFMVGIITESDIVKRLASNKHRADEKVEKVMSFPVTAINASTKLEKAGKVIDTKHFRRYPVVDSGKLVGMVTGLEVVHEINKNISLHRNIQNIVIIIFVLFEFAVFFLYKHILVFFVR
jgi:CBS domain-containing protein